MAKVKSRRQLFSLLLRVVLPASYPRGNTALLVFIHGRIGVGRTRATVFGRHGA